MGVSVASGGGAGIWDWGVGIPQKRGVLRLRLDFAVGGPSPQPLSRGERGFQAQGIPDVHWMLTLRTFQ